MSGKNVAKYTKIELALAGDAKKPVHLYAGAKVRSAVTELSKDMTLYHGVRFAEVVEAVYKQGLKDGRREVIEAFDGDVKKKMNYLPPGRPKK